MKQSTLLIILLISVPAVFAQLPWAVSDLRCGDDTLDQFELCEDEVDESWCDELGTLLKVASACDTAHCTCVPRVNKAFCGNDRREGIEVCDGTGEDFCPEYGKLINISLVCDPDTCGCKIDQLVPEAYNPLLVESFANESQRVANCGNKKLEGGEQCDPPNTLCTTNRDESGVCTDDCRCLSPQELVAEEQGQTETISETTNVIETNQTEVNVTTLNVTETANQTTETEEDGWLTKLWQWIADVFS